MQDSVRAVLKPDETLDDLQRAGLRIIQKRRGFRFCTDSVLLADFCAAGEAEHIADMGTGTGVIPLLIAGRTGRTILEGFEIQEEIAGMARRSVALCGLEDRIRVHTADIREAGRLIGYERMDAVVTNPPYLREGEGLTSPDRTRALSRGGAGAMPAGEWIAACGRILKNGGRLCVVFPADRLARLFEAMRACRIEPKRIRFVASGQDKAARLVLAEGKKQGGEGLTVLPTLITHDASGSYTEEMRRIYGDAE